MNYSEISKKRDEEVTLETELEETCEACMINYPEPEPEATNEVFGVVSGCGMLNVREEPDTTAKVVAVIKKGTVLEIDMENSDIDWLCVCTASGVEGFCMAQYVDIND